MVNYNDIKDCIERNNLTVKIERTKDPHSGWVSRNIMVFDKDHLITDFSGNGYCYDELHIKKSYNDLIEYIKFRNIQTKEDLADWFEFVAKK